MRWTTAMYNESVWSARSEDVRADAGRMAARTFRWPAVRAVRTQSFDAADRPEAVVHESLGGEVAGVGVVQLYTQLKEWQRKHHGADTRVVRVCVPGPVWIRHTVDLLLAALHILLDQEQCMGEPNDCPTICLLIPPTGLHTLWLLGQALCEDADDRPCSFAILDTLLCVLRTMPPPE